MRPKIKKPRPRKNSKRAVHVMHEITSWAVEVPNDDGSMREVKEFKSLSAAIRFANELAKSDTEQFSGHIDLSKVPPQYLSQLSR